MHQLSRNNCGSMYLLICARRTSDVPCTIKHVSVAITIAFLFFFFNCPKCRMEHDMLSIRNAFVKWAPQLKFRTWAECPSNFLRHRIHSPTPKKTVSSCKCSESFALCATRSTADTLPIAGHTAFDYNFHFHSLRDLPLALSTLTHTLAAMGDNDRARIFNENISISAESTGSDTLTFTVLLFLSMLKRSD